MGFVKKIWVNRSTEFPNRRKETAVAGQADTYDYTRAEGTVFAEGTKPDATNLNDLEDRIEDAINERTGVTLWTNPSPTSSFAAQTVTLSDVIENYDYYSIVYYQSASFNQYEYTTGLISADKLCIFEVASKILIQRDVSSAPSGASFSFGNSINFPTYNGASSINNNNVIPYKILGYKSK